jgi:hypothetical protein
MTMQKTPWVEHLKSTYRWQSFTDWLKAGFLGPIPEPTLPPQQWLRLPTRAVRQMTQAADRWLHLVLKERQQRGLGWNEEVDRPLLAADLAARLVNERDIPTQPGWVLWWIEQEMRWLIRLVEAPESVLPMGVWPEGSSEVRYRALALGLARVCQWYVALEGLCEMGEAREELRAAAARVRERATERTAA